MPDNDGQTTDGTVTVTAASASKKYAASIYTGPNSTLPAEFADGILELEKALELPVFLIVQTYESEDKSQAFLEEIDGVLYHSILANLDSLPKGPVAILIESPGGYANCAYQITMVFRNRCQRSMAIIPGYAKSAATLLALGSNEILLGLEGELGPIDAQIREADEEREFSALAEAQSLERLHAFALEAFDQTMLLLLRKTPKRVGTLIPMVLDFVSDMMRPLFEKVDVVHYSSMSRALKEAEEYARRLLEARYPALKAKEVAHRLVETYPEHGFVIDILEANRLDQNLVGTVPAKIQAIIDKFRPHIGGIIAIGRIKEVADA